MYCMEACYVVGFECVYMSLFSIKWFLTIWTIVIFVTYLSSFHDCLNVCVCVIHVFDIPFSTASLILWSTWVSSVLGRKLKTVWTNTFYSKTMAGFILVFIHSQGVESRRMERGSLLVVNSNLRFGETSFPSQAWETTVNPSALLYVQIPTPTLCLANLTTWQPRPSGQLFLELPVQLVHFIAQ